MNDNPLRIRLQARLQTILDIIGEHSELLNRNPHLTYDYIAHFEQHVDFTVANLQTYTALQRSTISQDPHSQITEIIEAYPVPAPQSYRPEDRSSALPPPPFTIQTGLPAPPYTSHRGRFQFYAVRRGRTQGIFNSWAECSTQVVGYSNYEFKGFYDLTAAQNYLQ